MPNFVYCTELVKSQPRFIADVWYEPKVTFWFTIQPFSPFTGSRVAWLLNASGTLSFAAVQELNKINASMKVLVVIFFNCAVYKIKVFHKTGALA
jgi:hypothetical protein